MMFDEVPPCRSIKHRMKGVPAKYRIEHPIHGITYRCWECLCREGFDNTSHNVTQIKTTLYGVNVLGLPEGEHTS